MNVAIEGRQVANAMLRWNSNSAYLRGRGCFWPTGMSRINQYLRSYGGSIEWGLCMPACPYDYNVAAIQIQDWGGFWDWVEPRLWFKMEDASAARKRTGLYLWASALCCAYDTNLMDQIKTGLDGHDWICVSAGYGGTLWVMIS